ncbi:MAG: ADP-ribosylglycohydrolase family protein [Clostridia bacterium]|nr:ADP-ribosylglycohydrolase family protein [Clostridia bacterium]
MVGAIIGDIAGSRFEFHNYRGKDFEIFSDKSFLTDDSYMTLAVAKAVKECRGDYAYLYEQAVKWMLEVGRKYPHCGFGGKFKRWVMSEKPHPYGSMGNGAAMRVSAAGFFARSLPEAREISYKVTAPTHGHWEGIKGAEATAVSIYLAKTGRDKAFIRSYVEENYYKLDFTVDGIRETYSFDETCPGTVPEALEVFLESSSFVDCVRTAVSLGGDCDTVAAIASSVAEAFYGVPDEMKRKAETYMDGYILNLFKDVEEGF